MAENIRSRCHYFHASEIISRVLFKGYSAVHENAQLYKHFPIFRLTYRCNKTDKLINNGARFLTNRNRSQLLNTIILKIVLPTAKSIAMLRIDRVCQPQSTKLQA